MSTTAILFRIYPKEGMLDKVMQNIRKALNPVGMQSEDIAFGIKTVKVLFKFDDEKTGSSSIEKSLKGVEGVDEVEVLEESLV
jgi:translation elongation factor EF-1beta